MPLKETKEENGNVTLKGGGWFWVTFSPKGNIVAEAKGMKGRPARREFVKRATAQFVRDHKPECESCGETVGPGSIRPWACSSRCYADIVGISHPDY